MMIDRFGSVQVQGGHVSSTGAPTAKFNVRVALATLLKKRDWYPPSRGRKLSISIK